MEGVMKYLIYIFIFPVIAFSNPLNEFNLENYFKPKGKLKYKSSDGRFICTGDIQNKGAFFVHQFKLKHPERSGLEEVTEEIQGFFNRTIENLYEVSGDLIAKGGLRLVEKTQAEPVNSVKLLSNVMHFVNTENPHSVPVGVGVFSWRIDDTAFLIQVTLVSSTRECSMVSIRGIAKEICSISAK